MSTPTKKAAARRVLEELAAVALELELLDAEQAKVRAPLAAKRDRLLLEARAATPAPSLRDVAAIGRVSHAWIRKLNARTTAAYVTPKGSS